VPQNAIDGKNSTHFLGRKIPVRFRGKTTLGPKAARINNAQTKIQILPRSKNRFIAPLPSSSKCVKDSNFFFADFTSQPFEQKVSTWKTGLILPELRWYFHCLRVVAAFMRKSYSAFTILEIMVVVALIGLLTAIVVPHLLSVRDRGNQKICISNLRQIDQAIELWAADNKALPTDTVMHTNLIPYLRVLPTCPASKGGTFYSDYGMTFVQDLSFCTANFSLASTPHMLNGSPVAVAAGDAPQSFTAQNFPKPRKTPRR
jgi:Tfp pilus assembly protein PilE